MQLGHDVIKVMGHPEVKVVSGRSQIASFIEMSHGMYGVRSPLGVKDCLEVKVIWAMGPKF